MKELQQIVQARTASPQARFALATVVRVEGSSYRRPGARMLIGINGQIAGSVSGGCLERHVVSRGLELIASGVPGRAELLTYDTTDDDDLAFGASLGCEGKVDILVEAVPVGSSWTLAEVAQSILAHRQAAALATIYRAPDASLLGHAAWRFPDGTDGSTLADRSLVFQLLPLLDAALAETDPRRRTRSLLLEHAGNSLEVLIERIEPPLPLILFGAGHDVPPLVRLAREMGHDVSVIDRRAEFADPLRFPGADRVIHAKGKQILSHLPSGAAAVVMNHHYATDRDLLGVLLATDVPLCYLGMLGPRKRILKIADELSLPSNALDRVHAPAGLDLGSENPEQIALAILAEIQAVRAGRSGGLLRDRRAPIHAPHEAPAQPCPSA